MNRNDLYNRWKNKRADVKVSEDFVDNVVDKIGQYHRRFEGALFDGTLLFDFLSYRWAKAALIAVGFISGLLRIGVVVGLFFGACSEAGGSVAWQN